MPFSAEEQSRIKHFLAYPDWVALSQSIQLGEASAVAAGGMENMTRAPHLLMNSRTGQRLGYATLIDSIVHDVLRCPLDNRHMGGPAAATG